MANADIDPPEAYVATHPAFRVLIVNTPLSAEFARYEAISVRAKSIYTFLGVFSLFAAFVTLSALIFLLTLGPGLANTPGGKELFAIVGALGVAAQVVLLAGPFKKRWLGARFLAERVRSVKFQAVAHAACADSDRAAAVEDFTKRCLADLAVSAEEPVAAMHDFEPERVLENPPQPGAALSPETLRELKDIYLKLRIDYQANFAIAQLTKLKEERKLPAAASEISFWAGAALGYVDAIVSLAHAHAPWLPALHFFTLFLFVLSALLFVLERGRSHNASIERYEDYRVGLARVGGGLARAHDAQALVDCVWAGERAALRELRAFCREADKSTYLF